MQAEASPTTISTPPHHSRAIDPASIPTRTSSTRATGNRETRASPKSSPRHRKSLGSVPEASRRRPEISEREWIAAARATRTSLPPSYSNNNNHNNHNNNNNSDNNYYSSTLLPFFTAPPPNNPPSPETLSVSPPSPWTSAKESILRGPYTYLDSHPGKDIRAQLIAAFNCWLNVPPASLAVITKVVGMLHTASLLIDDVEDSSSLRRGVPVAHSIFGTAQTINSANYVYFCALQELLQLGGGGGEAVRIYTEELVNLHRGQGMDLFWRDTLTCPSEDDYLEMVGNKTGGLFRLAIKLMCAESPSHQAALRRAPSPAAEGGASQNGSTPAATASAAAQAESGAVQSKPDYIPLANTIGLLFQILDDYRNLSDTAYTANKGLCEDLTEGKFSFPIIHAIRADPRNLVLLNILKQKTADEDVKRYAVRYMEGTGSFAYTRRVLRGLTRRALGLVELVDAGRGEGVGVKGILDRLRLSSGHEKANSMT